MDDVDTELENVRSKLAQVEQEYAQLKWMEPNPASLATVERLIQLEKQKSTLLLHKYGVIRSSSSQQQGGASAAGFSLHVKQYKLELVPSACTAEVDLYRVVNLDDGSQVYENGMPSYFVDAGKDKAVKVLEDWLSYHAACFEPPGSSRIPFPMMGPRTILINGFIKAGKSYTLNIVLPAIVSQHPRFGMGQPEQMFLCPLDFATITLRGEVWWSTGIDALIAAGGFRAFYPNQRGNI
mmetsp:Transcript_19194/g.41453  ORF Transcript_19194/g.41453 Transcript_19194/m.41453 type:complete len:238 (+) Transcript_19194:86-799(+)|eukprot:CAMPEP_0202893388 /NCGR_PEP_ID=MMETSP1392-20130828/2982_1 /ASSEMBLY_ACC=CAM_ASM_000868 /TAXON_ID=225041 /ORGANISM="Chlamydomonas chlamydogama, Strain SAG 11-48b" /LENGTH=237 /DNA_ID=CAMNT_0049577701 /DNA_START=84 /DNA_END=797 /DNA_ORIENTATION=-